MSMLLKRYFFSLLCIFLLVFFLPIPAFSAEGERTIDLNRKQDYSGKGYNWDASEKKLTLKNARITGTIIMPAGCDVEILLEGENFIASPDGGAAIIRDYSGKDREEYFDTFDILDQGDITFKSEKGGCLTVRGNIAVYGHGMMTIDNCNITALCQQWNDGYPLSCTFHTSTDLQIVNQGQLLLNGYGYSKDTYLDEGILKNADLGDYVSFSVSGNMELKNGSVLSLHDTSSITRNEVLSVTHDVTASSGTEFSVLNRCSHSNAAAVSLGPRTQMVSLLSDRILISSCGEKALFLQTERVETDLILPKELRSFYHTDLTVYADQWYYTNLLDEENRVVTELDYITEKKAAARKRIIEGMKDTEVFLKSSYTANDNIRLDWSKSPGYCVDYYEVFRSVKRSSGYGKKAFYRTQSGRKHNYTNTSTRAGIRYYYKVRGVREIDGKRYYTCWSNKAWLEAK